MILKRLSKRIVPVIILAIILIIAWTRSPAGLQGKTWWIGSAVCHQLPEHSFHLQDMQFPLCVRCTGAYLSSSIAMLYFAFKGKRGAIPTKWIIVLFVGFFLFWALDGLNSFSYDVLNNTLLYIPSNTLRFVSGIGMGMTFALTITTILNTVFWEDAPKSALLTNWKDVCLLLLIESPLLFFPLNRSPFLFNTAALVSTLGVLTLIAMLYAILIVIITRKEGGYRNLADVLPIIALGYAIAILQLLLMVELRMSIFPITINPL